MLTARFLLPWKESNFQATGKTPEARNKHLLVDGWKIPATVYALSTNMEIGVARKLLKLFLKFGKPLLVCGNPEAELTAKMVDRLCRWLQVLIDNDPVEHSRARDEYVHSALWIHCTTLDTRLIIHPTPFRLLLAATLKQNSTPFNGRSTGATGSSVCDAWLRSRQATCCQGGENGPTVTTRGQATGAGAPHRWNRPFLCGRYGTSRGQDTGEREEHHHEKAAHPRISDETLGVTKFFLPGLSYNVIMNNGKIRHRRF